MLRPKKKYTIGIDGKKIKNTASQRRVSHETRDSSNLNRGKVGGTNTSDTIEAIKYSNSNVNPTIKSNAPVADVDTNSKSLSVKNVKPNIMKNKSIAKYKNGGTIGKNVKARESKPMLPKTEGYSKSTSELNKDKESYSISASNWSTKRGDLADVIENNFYDKLDNANKEIKKNKSTNEANRKYIKKTIAPKYSKGTKGVNPLDNVDTSAYEKPKKKDKPVSQESLDNAPVDLPKKEDRSLDTLDTSAGDKFAVNKKIDRGFSEGNKLVRGGSTALAKYQKELRAAGYNIKVDGAWKDGGETDLAHRDYKAKQEAAKKKEPKKEEPKVEEPKKDAVVEKVDGVEKPVDEQKVTGEDIGLDTPKTNKYQEFLKRNGGEGFTSKGGIRYTADYAYRTKNGKEEQGEWELNEKGKPVITFKTTKSATSSTSKDKETSAISNVDPKYIENGRINTLKLKADNAAKMQADKDASNAEAEKVSAEARALYNTDKKAWREKMEIALALRNGSSVDSVNARIKRGFYKSK
jgi:hypothetical protein